jgi:Cytochrome C'
MKRLLLSSLVAFFLVGDARAQAPAPAADNAASGDAGLVDGRSVVQRRMSKHGASLMELTLAVTLLQRKTIAEAATRIGSDTGLPVMPPSSTETQSQRNFRYLEGVLRKRTTTLAQASSNGDNAALATAFGNMMQACIACHSLYLHQPDQAAPKP